VLELARILAGPWAGQLLADLGADVIKVERPEVGDDTRHWGPPFAADGAAAYFHACNRGKKSVALDFEQPEDLEKVRVLAAEADVLIENFKVGGLARYGLDHPPCRDQPGLSLLLDHRASGRPAPMRRAPGYDFIIQGMGGAMSLTGEPDGRTAESRDRLCRHLHRPLFHRGDPRRPSRPRPHGPRRPHRHGALDTQVGVLANQALNWMVSGKVPHRMGNGHSNLVPYQAFKVATAR
jgi:crotonobetainyl-CoA:carnitine CoA-transferase CaiB-like acyl-CoA transferase